MLLLQSIGDPIKILCVRHPTLWVSQLYCKSAHISLILLILPLFDDLFHILTFQKLEFKVCSCLVIYVH